MGTLCALSSFMLLFAIGCGGGSGGGGGGESSSNNAAAIATAPIDLPAGQTTAQLAWAPSEGEVTGYLVFQSHDQEEFSFLDQVASPEIQITGTPGDSIRILVIALGAASSQSEASPPSPPVRFHAAVGAVAAVESAAPAVATASSTTQAQTTDSEPNAAEAADSSADADEFADSTEPDGNEEDESVLDLALRDELL